ncbi:ankyrin repeat domain-containing protein [Hyunsoonleella rubra]|uniref:Ankyrin repeat domain-containing protein n=1 Tax=Hyunsoonleella rubra TaxID=1737062 RepID=A0ABW5TC83_9FLAO
MNKEEDLLKEMGHYIELHSVDGIKNCFKKGLNPNAQYEGKTLFELLTSMYTRTSRFRNCVQLFVDYGLEFENESLLCVLLDDSSELSRQIQKNPELVKQRITLECAYTPLERASLLHVCAEFNHIHCAQVLLDSGMDVDIKSGFDENGFGGQTPIFHTVNQNMNNSKEMMHLLLDNGADLKYNVQGLIWGKGFPWETFIPCINPISYAMFGLLPQMHRNEHIINDVVKELMRRAFGMDYEIPNIPNVYLSQN